MFAFFLKIQYLLNIGKLDSFNDTFQFMLFTCSSFLISLQVFEGGYFNKECTLHCERA